MEGKGDQRKVEEITRIVLRPLASPLPLAFFTFGVGSVLQSAFQFGVIPQGESRNLALIFGGVVFPSMFLAAILAFLSRETLGATALGLISFSWLATSLVTYTSAPDPTSAALGVLDLAIATVLSFLGTLGVLGKPVLSAVILLAFCRYGLNGLYELTAAGWAQTASGVVGCAIFAASLYGGLALGLEDVQHRTVLPFGRRGEAREAIEGASGSRSDRWRRRPGSANSFRCPGTQEHRLTSHSIGQRSFWRHYPRPRRQEVFDGGARPTGRPVHKGEQRWPTRCRSARISLDARGRPRSTWATGCATRGSVRSGASAGSS